MPLPWKLLTIILYNQYECNRKAGRVLHNFCTSKEVIRSPERHKLSVSSPLSQGCTVFNDDALCSNIITHKTQRERRKG